MRSFLLVFILIFSTVISFSADARQYSQKEVRRACRKFLAMSPSQQRVVAKRSKQYSREQMIWACEYILSGNGGGSSGSGSGSGPSTEPGWQCRAEGEVGRQHVTGVGTSESRATAESFAISQCGGDCHVFSCSESQIGGTTQWQCWAEGESYSRKETFDGSTENDRSRAESSALSACSWRAKSCSIVSCSNR